MFIMKKILLFIVSVFSVLLFNHCFWYDVVIYGPNNEFITMYPVEDSIVEITLDWNWSKNWNNYTFEDWFYWVQVNYVDSYWENQTLTWLTDLYINWNNTISYTGTQYLSLTDSTCWVFNWYTPTFDITWNITEIDTWNVFNNFADNSLKVLLSNIPNYIQYVIIIMLLFFVLGFIRKMKRR